MKRRNFHREGAKSRRSEKWILSRGCNGLLGRVNGGLGFGRDWEGRGVFYAGTRVRCFVRYNQSLRIPPGGLRVVFQVEKDGWKKQKDMLTRTRAWHTEKWIRQMTFERLLVPPEHHGFVLASVHRCERGLIAVFHHVHAGQLFILRRGQLYPSKRVGLARL
jgi:hypothetical protein